MQTNPPVSKTEHKTGALPNFLIIGAPKCGTTSLHDYLKQHPDIYMPELKEPRFFSFNEDNPEHWEKAGRTFPITRWEQYVSLFSGVKDEAAIGEASPGYLNSGFAPDKIKCYLGNVKLIAVLRNPVDRTYSEYLMRVRSGVDRRSLLEAFRAQERWVLSSRYAEDIARYLDRFGPDALKVLLFEEWTADPLAGVQALYAFLGVDSTFKPDLSTQHNVGGMPKSGWLHHALSRLGPRGKLRLPKTLRRIGSRIKKANLDKAPVIQPPERQEMYGVFADDIARLETLLGRDLSRWRPQGI